MLHYRLFVLETDLRISLLVLAALLSYSLTCAAQPAAKSDITTESLSIGWASASYPATAKLKGEQGTASVRIDFLNGRPSGPASIAKTSGSAALDDAAIKTVSTLSFKSAGTESAPDLKKFIVEVEFIRDSHTTIAKKPCAELTADIQFFRQVNPGVEIKKMSLYTMSLGFVALSGDMKNVAGMVKLAKAMPLAFDATALACEKNPDALYLEVLLKALQAATQGKSPEQ
jgi:TonB family protein